MSPTGIVSPDSRGTVETVLGDAEGAGTIAPDVCESFGGAASSATGWPEGERRALAAGFKLLSDETRLHLLGLLSHGERCVCHLTALAGLPQGTVSHHLGILRRAGWVRDRRDVNDYRWTYYSLNLERIEELQALLGRFLDPGEAGQPSPPCPDEGPTGGSR